MAGIILTNKEEKPDSAVLSKVLKDTYIYFTELLELTKAYRVSWSFSKASGWVQKTADNKKALYYLIPLNGAIQINLTLRENERELLLHNGILTFAYEAMLSAKKYAEGFLLQFTVSDEQSFKDCKTFIAELIKLR